MPKGSTPEMQSFGQQANAIIAELGNGWTSDKTKETSVLVTRSRGKIQLTLKQARQNILVQPTDPIKGKGLPPLPTETIEPGTRPDVAAEWVRDVAKAYALWLKNAEAAKPAAKKTARPAAKKTARPAAKKTARPAAKKTARPAAKKTARPAAKKTARPARTKVAKAETGETEPVSAFVVGKPKLVPKAKMEAKAGKPRGDDVKTEPSTPTPTKRTLKRGRRFIPAPSRQNSRPRRIEVIVR